MDDEVDVRVAVNGRPHNREDVTAGHADVPVRFYRTDGSPTLFAGLQVAWIDGDDPETGTQFSLTAGAGVGSRYLTLCVEVPHSVPVYEFVDVTELLQRRVAAIVEEVHGDG